MDILGDCGSPDPGSIPGPGPSFYIIIMLLVLIYELTGHIYPLP